jgi:uncharacterized membrane protein
MEKTKKYFYAFLILLVIFSVSIWKRVLAEDENENERKDDGNVTTVIDTSPAKNTIKKTETVTEYRKLSDTITQLITTITRHDSDGDGLYDDEDTHPTINDYFIVADANLDGIDDRYEQQS